MKTRKTGLLVSDAELGAVLEGMYGEYEFWQVARERDAMAYLKEHGVDLVALDLDQLGEDAEGFLDALRSVLPSKRCRLVGLTRNPERIAPSLTTRLDQWNKL